MLDRSRRHKLGRVRGCILAARVGVCCGSAVSLPATIRNLAAGSAGRETIQWPKKQNRQHQADRNVNSTPHFAHTSIMKRPTGIADEFKARIAELTGKQRINATGEELLRAVPRLPCRTVRLLAGHHNHLLVVAFVFALSSIRERCGKTVNSALNFR
jgi:hypothetical protein